MKKSSSLINISGLLILFILSMVQSSCSGLFEVRVNDDYDLKMPASKEKIPLRVGLFASQIRNYTFEGENVLITVYLGDGISRGAERALKIAFKEVALIDNMESSISAHNIDLIVTPEIVDHSFRRGFWPFQWNCRVSCKWTMSDPYGKVSYMNTFTGEATGGKDSCMTSAVQEQFNKFLADILSKKWPVQK